MMFNFNRVKDLIFENEYIAYLKQIGIDTDIIINNIRTNLETHGYKADKIFSNSSYKMFSPNISLEELVFKEINTYVYENFKDSIIFEEYIRIDSKSIIATQNSFIERPNINKPSETKEGFKNILDEENGFIRIARFESEMIQDSDTWGRKGQTIIFEGLSIFGKKNPFIQYLPSFLIWHNAFYYKEDFIIGLIKNFNSIESNHILWLNSKLLALLGLKLDTFNHGLRALNSDKEIVLEFRQWRKQLIGNSISFVGTDSNIAKLEGCDLMLREDYLEILKHYIPEFQFYTDRLDFPET